MKKNPILLLLIILFPLLTFSQSSSDWERFENKNFVVNYPASWTFTENPQLNVLFFINSPLESESDRFSENVNLLEQDLAGYKLDLEKYTEISLHQIETLITNSSILESSTFEKDGEKWQKVIYTGDQGTFKLNFVQYYRVKNDSAHVFTFTSEQDSAEDYKEKTEQIFSSFHLLK